MLAFTSDRENFAVSSLASSLPTELEREILELTALVYPKYIPQLLAVAQRAKAWIEPIRFRTLIFSKSPNENPYSKECSKHYISMVQFLYAVESKPASFFQKHVRNIAFPHMYTTAEMQSVLSVCTNATNVLICEAVEPSLLPVLAAMPLQRLGVDLSHLFPVQIDFTHALFSRITHLQPFHALPAPGDWSHWSGLADMPRLTHLALDRCLGSAVWGGALQHCKSLAVLIVVGNTSDLDPGEVSLDPRFVVFDGSMVASAQNWRAGTCGGTDRWAQAEAFVAKKRAAKA
ncbi:hypothetical protein C8R44DRAFT_864990 [Mycena epipterygia]|nr:hypothetical protein C8R44DRAFT_864990 [Mycena epipterygia]